jgi:hypothetical protein
MRRRTRLVWVTALTVASLLLALGAMSALADDNGGRGNGKGRGSSTAQRQSPPAQPQRVTASRDDKDDKKADKAEAKADKAEVRLDAADKHDDDDRGMANRQNRVRDDDEDEDEDLVTGPDRVTQGDRPGLGCGDRNHEHTGPPGNPDKECKDRGDEAADDGAEAEDEDAHEGRGRGRGGSDSSGDSS